MTYSESDRNQMFDFLRSKYQNPKDIDKIHEFQCRYDQVDPIQWYTKDWFLYSDLNKALREYDIVYLYGIRVFIKDLHQQIVRSHMKSKESTILKLYRGIALEQGKREDTAVQLQSVCDFSDERSTISGNTIITSYREAMLCWMQGKWDLAVENLEAIYDIITSEDHPHLAPTYAHIGDLLKKEKKFSEALNHYGRALSILQRYLSSTNSALLEVSNIFVNTHLAYAYESISNLLYKQGDLCGTLEHLQHTMKARLQYLPPTDLAIAKLHTRLGDLQVSLQRNEEALSNFERALVIQAASLPADHLDIAETHTMIGRILLRQQKFREALKSYECALEILFESFASANLAKDETSIKSRNSFLVDIYALIGDVHCKTRNFSEAYQNYELALDIQLECTSAMDPTTHKIIKKLNCVHRLLVRLIT
ncbi:unnamed protein product [Rotaria sp. Silwood2]|nr:unnamed protein product [Rotaria sp. Silwood2]CAF4299955.1 unnamed protein product [Rotaria sp. Silwood2]CAF4319233.1 unnamed protein product [Rotaria sp. Silwood2]CAF4338385.1 unnamed protein product [Rotaria sp. Silwood2]